MKQYLDIVERVLNKGQWKSPVRKNQQTGKWEPVDGGVRTLACANVLFSHDMCDGFPLLTTKRMAWKTLCVELEGFIGGITDKTWFQERRCKIWDEWANPEAAREHFDRANAMAGGEPAEWNWENRKIAQREATDLGPIYGYQWRSFDQHYGVEPMCQNSDGSGEDYYEEWIYQCAEINGVPGGTDQLKNIVDTLTNNPMDRRMVCSAWNPNQIHLMALPPCHYAWNVTVIGDELNLFWAQRSCDLMLGVPFNIASYALLLCLLAEVGGFKRGNLSGMLVDCHIYENQIESAREQLKREPRPLPEVIIRRESPIDAVKRDARGEPRPAFDIFEWEYKDVELIDYHPHEKLEFGGVVV